MCPQLQRFDNPARVSSVFFGRHARFPSLMALPVGRTLSHYACLPTVRFIAHPLTTLARDQSDNAISKNPCAGRVGNVPIVVGDAPVCAAKSHSYTFSEAMRSASARWAAISTHRRVERRSTIGTVH